MSKFVVGLLLVTVGKIYLCQSAKILAFISTPSYSHQVVFQPLWKELSLKGHQVTVITTNPVNDPTLTNLTEIDISFSFKVKDNLIKIFEEHNVFKAIAKSVEGAHRLLEKQLEYLPVKSLLHDPTAHFDLVFVEHLLPAPAAIAKRFNCPFILVACTEVPNSAYKALGNPLHPIAHPNFWVITQEESITSRIETFLTEYFCQILIKWFLLPLQQKLIYEYFGHTYDITEQVSNASAFFVNTHPLYQTAKALTPNIIEIGGHPQRVPQNKSMTKDVKEFLDNAEGGFVYFSLGSNVLSKDMSEDQLNVVVGAFRELPYRVIWKYETENVFEKPSNVLIKKWVSQEAVLGHPNIKLFITHGGTLSIEEGIFARVPLLGIPVYLDQPLNIQRLVRHGVSLSVDYYNLDKDDFKSKILEMIENPIYRTRTIEFANLVEDQPMNGLDRAVWWTEHVLRHKGAKHLRSPLLNMPWYQYYLLDVLGVLLLVVVIVFVAGIYVIKYFLNVLKSLLIMKKGKLKVA